MALDTVQTITSGQQNWDAPINDDLELLGRLWTPTVSAKTASYPLVDADDKKVFTNRGAGGSVTFTLPVASGRQGMRVTFMVLANQTIIVAGTAGEVVTKNNAAATSVALQTTNEKIGGVIEAFCDGTSWFVFGTSVGHTYTVA